MQKRRTEKNINSVNWKNIIWSKSYSSVIFVKDLQSNSKYSRESIYSQETYWKVLMLTDDQHVSGALTESKVVEEKLN